MFGSAFLQLRNSSRLRYLTYTMYRWSGHCSLCLLDGICLIATRSYGCYNFFIILSSTCVSIQIYLLHCTLLDDMCIEHLFARDFRSTLVHEPEK